MHGIKEDNTHYLVTKILKIYKNKKQNYRQLNRKMGKTSEYAFHKSDHSLLIYD